MNRLPAIPILEWSPQGCRLIDPVTRKVIGAQTAAEVLELAGRPKLVVLALGRRQNFERTVRLPDIPKPEALNILKFQLEDLFPIETYDIAYDIEITTDINAEGRLAVVYATKAETLRQARSEIEKAGSKVARTIPASLGAAVIAKAQHIDPAIIIDRSPEGISFDVVQHGHVTLSRTTSGELNPTQMGSEIARTLASANLASAEVASHEDWQTPSVNIQSGQSATVALLDADTTVEFQLPEDKLAAESKVVTNRRSLAVLIVGATVALGALFIMDRDDLNRNIQKAKKKWDYESGVITKNNTELKAKFAILETKGNLVSNGFQPKQYASDIVAEVSNAVTEGIWLTGISFERGRPLMIRGIAKNQNQVAAYVDELNATDRLRNVTLSFANASQIEDTDVAQFSITAHVVGNFPLDDPSKTKTTKR